MDEEQEMDSPVECVVCHEVFDGAIHFLIKPYRPICPFCGAIHHNED